jgi:hypothetical protein
MITPIPAWATPGSWVWRRKLKVLGEALGVSDIAGMTVRFGARWAYKLRDVVARFQLQEYPNEEAYIADGRQPFREMEGSRDILCSIVHPGRTTLAEAIVEALAQLVKQKTRKIRLISVSRMESPANSRFCA